MNSRTALVAHPFPIVVEALGHVVAAAGYRIVAASDAAALAAGVAAVPDLVVVAAAFADAVPALNGAARLVVADGAPTDGVAGGGAAGAPPTAAIALTAPVADLRAAIAAVAGAATGPALTARERDVARLVAAGQRNRVIAATLGISEGTVKMHLHNVYTKLGLESRTQLAMATAALAR